MQNPRKDDDKSLLWISWTS